MDPKKSLPLDTAILKINPQHLMHPSDYISYTSDCKIILIFFLLCVCDDVTDIKQKLDNEFSHLACLQVNFQSAKLNAGNPILFKLRSDIKDSILLARQCSTVVTY